MIIGCCFICVFAVLINKVSLQETLEADVGGSVVLPCSSTEHDHKLQDIDVKWRHNDSEIVCDIVNGKDSVEQQHPRYKNRTETFPDDYLRGNFSIKLNNLQYTDVGEFSCLITQSSEHQTIQLIIKESTKKESNSTEQEGDKGEDTDANSVKTPLTIICIVLIALLFTFLIWFCCRKKNQAPSFSSARRKNIDTNDMSGLKD